MLKDPATITNSTHAHITQPLCNETTGTLTSIPPEWYSDTVHWPGLRLHHHVYHSLRGCGEEYEMATTNNTCQCLHCAKDGEIPQRNGYFIDNTEIICMAQNP